MVRGGELCGESFSIFLCDTSKKQSLFHLRQAESIEKVLNFHAATILYKF